MIKLAVILSLTMLTLGGFAMAGDKTLVWDPNSEPDLAGYKVYFRQIGTESWIMKDVGNVVAVSKSDLGITEDGYEYYVTAYDTSGNESGPSNMVDDKPPAHPTGCRWR